MIRVTEKDAKTYTASLLKAVGCPAAEAKVVADVMITANLRGVDSHGILRLPIYLKRLRLEVPKVGKLINPKPKMKVVKKKGATAIFDADRGMGQLAGTRAMKLCIELAKKYGVGTVGVVNSNHFGTCAQFCCQAADKGCIGLSVTHGESDVVPFGGTKPILGTNPIGFAAPLGKFPFPLSVDMATSIVAFGKVFQAQAKGEAIPPDWALTAEGQATTDPNKVRAIRGMAGPKGTGLSLMIDILSGVLTGAHYGLTVRRMYHNFEQPQEVGHLMIAIDIAHFMPVRQFKQRIDALADMIKMCPPEPPNKEVYLPGEIEHYKHCQRSREGIDLPEDLVKQLNEHAAQLGVKSPW